MTSSARPVYNVPRGTAYITGQQIIVYLTYLVFYIVIARVLTKSEVGVISLLSAVNAAFLTLTQLALPQAATRYISSHIGTDKLLLSGSVAKTTLRLTLLIAVPATFLTVLYSPWVSRQLFGTQNYTLAVAAMFLTGLILDLYILYGGFFLGAGLYAEYAYQTILYIPLSRAIGILLALLGMGVLGIALGWVVGGTAALILSIYYWHNRLPQRNQYPLRPLLTFALPLFAATLINTGQQWGDVGILQLRLGQLSITGGYYVIITSVGFLSALWFPIANALYPSLSVAHATIGSKEVETKLSIAFRLTNLATLPIGAAIAALAPTVLEVVFGPSYAVDALPFAILALSTVLVAQGAILTTTLQAVGRTSRLLLATLGSTSLDLTWTWLAAPALGTTAGATGRALLYGSTVYLSYKLLLPGVKARPFNDLVKALVVAAGVGLPLFAINQFFIGFTTMGPLLRVPVLACVFLATFVGASRRARAFKSADFALLKDVIPHRYHSLLKRIERLITTTSH